MFVCFSYCIYKVIACIKFGIIVLVEDRRCFAYCILFIALVSSLECGSLLVYKVVIMLYIKFGIIVLIKEACLFWFLTLADKREERECETISIALGILFVWAQGILFLCEYTPLSLRMCVNLMPALVTSCTRVLWVSEVRLYPAREMDAILRYILPISHGIMS